MDEKIKIVAQKIKNAENIVVFTGAGISKASGIPTFRGKDGLWGKYSPSELATMNAFVKNPKLVWQWYNYRKELIKKSKPNKAHYAIVELEKMFQNRFALITQNIDSLHKEAGTKTLYELHGNIFEVRCLRCGKIYEDKKIYKEDELVPKCKFCKEGSLRPNVVWFGENLDMNILDSAMRKAAASDIFIAIGTSGVVQPAASLPKIAHDNGAFVVEINIEYSAISIYTDETIIGAADTILPEILNQSN
jgi:NAD-dependent deacetylase